MHVQLCFRLPVVQPLAVGSAGLRLSSIKRWDLRRESYTSHRTTCRMMATNDGDKGNSKETAKGFGKQQQTKASIGGSKDGDSSEASTGYRLFQIALAPFHGNGGLIRRN